MKPLLILSVVAAVAFGGVAIAQTMHDAHGSTASAKDTAATKAYRAANEKMHKDMDQRFSNDPDVDFIRGMIPHHQGAIDMAKVELQYGKDPKLRAMAEAIVKAQEEEIATMKAWQQSHQ